MSAIIMECVGGMIVIKALSAGSMLCLIHRYTIHRFE